MTSTQTKSPSVHNDKLQVTPSICVNLSELSASCPSFVDTGRTLGHTKYPIKQPNPNYRGDRPNGIPKEDIRIIHNTSNDTDGQIHRVWDERRELTKFHSIQHISETTREPQQEQYFYRKSSLSCGRSLDSVFEV